MTARHWHKVGDYLVKSDQSGRVFYASEMVKQWDGLLVHHTEFEIRHPQDFVRPQKDPEPLHEVRIKSPATVYVDLVDHEVGETSVPAPQGPAFHLFSPDGVGGWVIETNWVVS